MHLLIFLGHFCKVNYLLDNLISSLLIIIQVILLPHSYSFYYRIPYKSSFSYLNQKKSRKNVSQSSQRTKPTMLS